MAKFTMEEAEDLTTFPAETILELKITESSIETVPGRDGRDPWEKVSLKFKILGIQALGDGGNPDDYDNWITKDIYGSVSARFTTSPENKLRQWAEAIFGMELGVGFELDTDLFVGRSVRGVTTQYELSKVDSTGKKPKRHRVDSLLPSKGTASAAAAQAPAAAPAAPPPSDPWGSPKSWDDEPPF